mgnify:CR=1 FL=1
MNIVFTCLLLALGVLGAANLIIAKKPEAKEIIAKISPYQGWIGVAGTATGIFWLIQTILHIANLGVFGLVISLVTNGVCIGLGLLLGIGTIKTFVGNEEVKAKLDEVVTKIAPYQGILGLIAIGLAVYGLISALTAGAPAAPVA